MSEFQKRLFERKCDTCWANPESCAVPETDLNCIGCKRYISKSAIQKRLTKQND